MSFKPLPSRLHQVVCVYSDFHFFPQIFFFGRSQVYEVYINCDILALNKSTKASECLIDASWNTRQEYVLTMCDRWRSMPAARKLRLFWDNFCNYIRILKIILLSVCTQIRSWDLPPNTNHPSYQLFTFVLSRTIFFQLIFGLWARPSSTGDQICTVLTWKQSRFPGSCSLEQTRYRGAVHQTWFFKRAGIYGWFSEKASIFK